MGITCNRTWMLILMCGVIYFGTTLADIDSKGLVQNKYKSVDAGADVKVTHRPSTSSNVIVTLSIIIFLLVLVVVALLYLLRKTIRTFIRDVLWPRRNKSSADIHQYTNDSFTNDTYTQSNVPKSEQLYGVSSNVSGVSSNKEYLQSSVSSTSRYGTSSAVTNQSVKTGVTEVAVDDFDSDTEIEINFPSPLNAPPLPPRPDRNKSPPTDGKHYMVSTIY